MEMFNPPHPGEILLELHIKPRKLKITKLAELLGVERKAVSRIIHGHTGISAEMALRLGRIFNTSPGLWLTLQKDYDLWQAKNSLQKTVARLKPLPKVQFEQSAY